MNLEDEFMQTVLGALGRYRSRVINTEIAKGGLIPLKECTAIEHLEIHMEDKPANRCELCEHLGPVRGLDPTIYRCNFRHVYIELNQGCPQFKALADVSPPPIQT